MTLTYKITFDLFRECKVSIKMPLTTKERQQRFIENLRRDPERYEAYKAKERKQYHNNKAIGIVKLINNKSGREQRSQRWQWRKAKHKQGQKLKDIEKELTPPNYPLNGEIRESTSDYSTFMLTPRNSEQPETES